MRLKQKIIEEPRGMRWHACGSVEDRVCEVGAFGGEAPAFWMVFEDLRKSDALHKCVCR